MDTVKKVLKKDWKITVQQIKELGIDEKKEFGHLTIDEVCCICDFLGISPDELIN